MQSFVVINIAPLKSMSGRQSAVCILVPSGLTQLFDPSGPHTWMVKQTQLHLCITASLTRSLCVSAEEMGLTLAAFP